MRTMLVAASVLASVCAASAAEWAVTEDGAATLSGSGAVELAASPTVSTLDVAKGTDATFTGAPILFADGACVTVDEVASVAFDVALTASGALSFARSDVAMCDSINEKFLSTTEDAVVLANTRLEDWVPVKARCRGNSIRTNEYYTAECVVWGDGYYTVQFQTRQDWIKCVKVRFEQKGDDVVARAVYARYMSLIASAVDFDSDSYAGSVNVAASDAAWGYGVQEITFAHNLRASGTGFVAKERVTLGADKALDVGAGMRFTASGEDVLGDLGAVAMPLVVAGDCAVTNAGTIAFGQPLAGTNGVLRVGGYTMELHMDQEEIAFGGGVPTTWTLFAENAQLALMTNVCVSAFGGTAILSTPNPDGWIRHFKNTGGSAVGQCQRDEGLIKCTYLEFRQNGKNVEVRNPEAWYTGAATGYGVDFDTLPIGSAGNGVRQKYSSGTNGYAYGIADFTAYFDVSRGGSTDASDGVAISFDAANAMTDATVEQYGGIATVTHIDGLPATGEYRVNGGTLVLSAAGCGLDRGVSKGGCTIVVKDGGTLEHAKAYNVDRLNQMIGLIGSTFVVSSLHANMSWNDGDLYVNRLELCDGSVLRGNVPRICYSMDATWNVTGTGASRCESGVCIASTGNNAFTLNVEDCTGDDASDFIWTKPIVTYDRQHRNVRVVKRGAGTMELACTKSFWVRPFMLASGTLQLSVSGVVDRYPSYKGGTLFESDFAFSGGTLACTAGTTNAFGAVYFEADSALALPADAPLAAAKEDEPVTFVSFTEIGSWETGAHLAITGPALKSGWRIGLRIGTEKTLTGDQIKLVKYNGEAVRQDAAGWLTCFRPGTCLLLR